MGREGAVHQEVSDSLRVHVGWGGQERGAGTQGREQSRQKVSRGSRCPAAAPGGLSDSLKTGISSQIIFHKRRILSERSVCLWRPGRREHISLSEVPLRK